MYVLLFQISFIKICLEKDNLKQRTCIFFRILLSKGTGWLSDTKNYSSYFAKKLLISH